MWHEKIHHDVGGIPDALERKNLISRIIPVILICSVLMVGIDLNSIAYADERLES